MRAFICAVLLTGCATTAPPALVPPTSAPQSPADAFFARLTSLCGKAFAGRVVSTEAADADMRGEKLVMHVRTCSADEIRIPFHVGADRSRTWVVRPMRIILTGARSGQQTGGWLQLKHDHRHADGSADVLTNYGGEGFGGTGTATRQSFPADEFSRALFQSKGNPASVNNVWAMEVEPGHIFAYELRRPNRYLRAEFDLSRPIPAPPPPWGAN